jgi:hypothetical protein
MVFQHANDREKCAPLNLILLKLCIDIAGIAGPLRVRLGAKPRSGLGYFRRRLHRIAR